MPDPILPRRSFHLFRPPYRRTEPLEDPLAQLRDLREWRGAALFWRMTAPLDPVEVEQAQGRPPGLPLVVVLPRADRIERPDAVLRVVELCRPQTVLPHHDPAEAGDLRSILARPPEDLPSEVTEYLAWRGVSVDTETRRLIRRTIELSAGLTTVQGLARSLYLSRRALGRRFMSRGLPVPSHWLQAGRILRAVIRLQNSDETLLVVASSLGYPDGFALSNQMKRLTGLRPSDARRFLGWEWLLESWLRREARAGSLQGLDGFPAPALAEPPRSEHRTGSPRPVRSNEARRQPA